MTQPTLSDEDQAKLDSGDYVIDPVFGVQPKTVDIAIRDREADRVAKSEQEQTQATAVATATPTPAAPSVPTVPAKTRPEPPVTP